MMRDWEVKYIKKDMITDRISVPFYKDEKMTYFVFIFATGNSIHKWLYPDRIKIECNDFSA